MVAVVEIVTGDVIVPLDFYCRRVQEFDSSS